MYCITNFIIPIHVKLVFKFGVVISLVLPITSYFVPVSQKGDVKQHVPTKIAAPGEALSAVWYVEQTGHVASIRKSNMSL